MKNNSFSSLTIPQQADMLLKEGFYLDTREEPGFFVNTYLLHTGMLRFILTKNRRTSFLLKPFIQAIV